MKPSQRMLLAICVMATGFRASATPIVTWSLFPPDGLLAGRAGTAVGWGYILNTTSDFVTIESIAFGDGTPIGTFSTPGVPSTAASDGSPINVPWVLDTSGLQYDISAAALVGTSTQGGMTLIYDAFSDPELLNQIAFAVTVNAQLNGNDVTAVVDVNAAALPGGVPEPGSAGLIAIGCAALAASWRARRGRTPRPFSPTAAAP